MTTPRPATASTAVRSYSVTFEPINHLPLAELFHGTPHQVIRKATSYARQLARGLGLSPLAIAVSVREAV